MKRIDDHTQGQSILYSVAHTARINGDINTTTEWFTVVLLDAEADKINKKDNLQRKRQTLDNEWA